MASIQLDNLSLTFRIRASGKLTMKEYVVKRLFRGKITNFVEVPALNNINLCASEGDRIGVIGHNGAGKSTLLKMIAGIYPPTSGYRTVNGRICSLFDIALGFEFDASGWDNITYRAYLQGETPKTLAPKLKEIAAFSELGDFLDLPVRYYSAGMLIRLAFSISTAIEPEVLLVDEVLSVGDLAFQIKARDRMQEMMKTARLMVVVTHELPTLDKICNKAVWMDHGTVRMFGTVDEVRKAYIRSVDPKGDNAKAAIAAKEKVVAA